MTHTTTQVEESGGVRGTSVAILICMAVEVPSPADPINRRFRAFRTVESGHFSFCFSFLASQFVAVAASCPRSFHTHRQTRAVSPRKKSNKSARLISLRICHFRRHPTLLAATFTTSLAFNIDISAIKSPVSCQINRSPSHHHHVIVHPQVSRR